MLQRLCIPTVDVHQHLWPESLISALARRTRPPRLAARGRVLELDEGRFDFDVSAHELDGRLRLLDRDEIDVALVSLQPTLGAEGDPELVDAYHEGIVELAAASGRRLRPLAAGACLDGFAGACVSAGAFVVGNEALLRGLEAAGQLLFVHPGPPVPPPAGSPPWWTSVVDYTAQVQAAFFSWIANGERPRVPVVFAILAGGAPFQLERLGTRGGGLPASENVYLDTASYGPRALELATASVGAESLVYGSDTPVIDARPTLDAVRSLGDRIAGGVLGKNASRLLP